MRLGGTSIRFGGTSIRFGGTSIRLGGTSISARGYIQSRTGESGHLATISTYRPLNHSTETETCVPTAQLCLDCGMSCVPTEDSTARPSTELNPETAEWCFLGAF